MNITGKMSIVDEQKDKKTAIKQKALQNRMRRATVNKKKKKKKTTTDEFTSQIKF